jgi:hypothetical protein
VVTDRIDALESFRKQLEGADVDLLREMVKIFAEQLMGADADAVCGADYGERSSERVNRRNGYRERPWDTRTGTIALQVPKLREGTYFPDWLLEPRRRAERAFVQVVAECYVRGVSTRRVEGLVRQLGSSGSRSRASRRWPPSSTKPSRRFAPAPWTAALIPTSGSTRSPRRSARMVGSRTSRRSWPRASTPPGSARSWAPGSSATTKAGCLRSRIAHTDRAAARTRLSTIAERLEKCVTELWYGRHHGKQCRRESSFLRLHSRCRRDGISRATGHFSSLITRPPSMLREEEQPADGAASPSLSPYPSGCRTVCRARREEVLRIGRAAHCPNHVRTGRVQAIGSMWSVEGRFSAT